MSEKQYDKYGFEILPRVEMSKAEKQRTKGVRALIALWMDATRARNEAEETLRAHGLSFSLWWILFVTDQLIRETSDAISQRDVMNRTELRRATVSDLMGELAERSLVDRGPQFESTAYRIILTDKGEALLARASRALELTTMSANYVKGR